MCVCVCVCELLCELSQKAGLTKQYQLVLFFILHKILNYLQYSFFIYTLKDGEIRYKQEQQFIQSTKDKM